MTLWNNLVTEENARVDIYLDHQNIPTIGVGFNLRNTDVLRLGINGVRTKLNSQFGIYLILLWFYICNLFL